jgi:hypothetical protein
VNAGKANIQLFGTEMKEMRLDKCARLRPLPLRVARWHISKTNIPHLDTFWRALCIIENVDIFYGHL